MTSDQPIEEGSFTRFNKEVQQELAQERQNTINNNFTHDSQSNSTNNVSQNLAITNQNIYDPMDETTDWSEIIEPTSIQDIKTPESTSKSTKDIRDSTTINETERIIYWCNMLDLGCNSAHEIVELFKAI
jgi:hypothetical protein